MTSLIRKISVGINLLLMTSIGYAYGDYDDLSNAGQDVQCFSCASSCCGQGFISAEFLYWRASQSGLDFCVSGDNSDSLDSDGILVTRFSGHAKDPDWEWSPGYRLGAGYGFGNCGWDIGVYWTHFYSKARGHQFGHQEFHWSLKLDLVDLVAGYDFCHSCFTIRPFGGLRFAQIEQHVKIGHASENSSGCYCNSFASNERNKQKFEGIGPIVGVEANWNLGCGFGINANAAISGLYGNYNVRYQSADAFSTEWNFCNSKRDLHDYQGILDVGIGITWETCFCNDMRLIFCLGLEHHSFFNQNRFCGYGDLNLDGGTFSAMIEF